MITLCYDWKLETWATRSIVDSSKKSDGEDIVYVDDDFHYMVRIKNIYRG